MGDNAEKLKVWQCTGMSDLGSQIPPDAAPEVLAISHVQFLDTDSEIPGFDGSISHFKQIDYKPLIGRLQPYLRAWVGWADDGISSARQHPQQLEFFHIVSYAVAHDRHVDVSCQMGDTGSFVIGPMLVMLVLLLVNYEPFHTFELQGLFINPLPT
ncbi:hypothetical protein DFH07DRAFT_777350 [Mycena maculata]|uniref:Uncharacterized protein n=1 Tax=Mycena maculata TaxID=230809 RepID=A0AAD7IK98_9AGAR|nr:hypothetical protein DFH07DRAFT_777350 [Mycena maculata]